MACSNHPTKNEIREARNSKAPQNMHQHHIFPVFRGSQPTRYSQFFKDVGIDVHEYTVPIEASKHYEVHGRGMYNEIWKGWIDEHYYENRLEERFELEVDARDVRRFAIQMIDHFGINDDDMMPYGTHW